VLYLSFWGASDLHWKRGWHACPSVGLLAYNGIMIKPKGKNNNACGWFLLYCTTDIVDEVHDTRARVSESVLILDLFLSVGLPDIGPQLAPKCLIILVILDRSYSSLRFLMCSSIRELGSFFVEQRRCMNCFFFVAAYVASVKVPISFDWWFWCVITVCLG